MKQDIVDRTNALRKENGISALTTSDKLMQAAQVRADEMAASGAYSHTRPDGRKYVTVTDCQYVGENIHCLEEWALKEKSLPETVMWAWAASAGHLKNMTNSRYGSIGVGLAEGTDENGADCWYCVQFLYGCRMFHQLGGSPRSQVITIQYYFVKCGLFLQPAFLFHRMRRNFL